MGGLEVNSLIVRTLCGTGSWWQQGRGYVEKEIYRGGPHTEKWRPWLEMEAWGAVSGGRRGLWGLRWPSLASPPAPSPCPPCPPPPPRALRQRELLFHFLQLVSGVEHYQQKFRSQAAVIDEIVDTAFEVNQAGPGRSQMEGEGTGRPGLGGFAWKPP